MRGFSVVRPARTLMRTAEPDVVRGPPRTIHAGYSALKSYLFPYFIYQADNPDAIVIRKHGRWYRGEEKATGKSDEQFSIQFTIPALTFLAC